MKLKIVALAILTAVAVIGCGDSPDLTKVSTTISSIQL